MNKEDYIDLVKSRILDVKSEAYDFDEVLGYLNQVRGLLEAGRILGAINSQEYIFYMNEAEEAKLYAINVIKNNR